MATEELSAAITATMDNSMTLRTSFLVSAAIECELSTRILLTTDDDARTGMITGY